MSKVRIVEQNYFEFTAALRSATDSGNKLEPRDKDAWKQYVRENHIQEAAFKSLADKKYEGMTPVVITDGGEWQGYYRFTTSEEAVLKWVRDES